ncbi:recombinase family protein [Kitasatospora sp. NPDC059811]|uniref:recombinase family protein n=1 Tax=Kitasatospora sp. NPDC059811 TaxID=3346957 RepID=UPI00365F1BE9
MDIYARKSVSRKGSRDAELSVNQQIADGIAWARRHGYRPRYVWVDNGISGSKDVHRPGYDAGLDALETGVTRCLWCYKLDRFSRKGALAVLTIMERLEGCRIFFGADNLDTTRAGDRRMIMWRAEDAKEFSDQLSGRVGDAWRHSKDTGLWLGWKVPYGLRKTKKRKLKADTSPAIPGQPNGPTKAEIARRILREVESGVTGPKVARGLNEDSVPTSTGGQWTPQHVYRMVKNPAYCGYQPSSDWDERDDNFHRDERGKRVRVGEALVTEAVHRRARTKITTRTLLFGVKPTAKGVRSTVRSELGGHLHCASCGFVMIKTGKSYACRAKNRAVGCDDPASVTASHAETFVRDAFITRLTNSDPEDPLIQTVAARWLASYRPDSVADRKTAEDRSENAKAALQDLMDARYKRKEFEDEAAQFYPGLLADAKREVSAAAKALTAMPKPNADVGFLMDAELVAEAWNTASADRRRELVGLALDGVCVRPKFGKGRTPVTADRFHYAWTGAPRIIEPAAPGKSKKVAKKGKAKRRSEEFDQAA